MLKKIFELYKAFFEEALVASGYKTEDNPPKSLIPIFFDYSQADRQQPPYGVLAWDGLETKEQKPTRDFSDGETVMGPMTEWIASLTFISRDPFLPVEALDICGSASSSDTIKGQMDALAKEQNITWPGFTRGLESAMNDNQVLSDQSALYAAAGIFSFIVGINRKFSETFPCVKVGEEAKLPAIDLNLE